MNDFFLHLAGRSFDRIEGIEKVHPRLPSIFEPVPEKPFDIEKRFSDAEFARSSENTQSEAPLFTSHMPAASKNHNSTERKDIQGRSAPIQEYTERGHFQSGGVISAANGNRVSSAGHATVHSQVLVEYQSHRPNEFRPTTSERTLSPSSAQTEPTHRREMNLTRENVSDDLGMSSNKADHNSEEQKQFREKLEQHPSTQVADRPMGENEQPLEHMEKTIECRLPSEKTRIESTIPMADRFSIRPTPPFRNRRTEGSFPRQTSNPESAIHVTIGRVEVRATAPVQKPAPKAANRSPVMGLDEYLRRRNGGR